MDQHRDQMERKKVEDSKCSKQTHQKKKKKKEKPLASNFTFTK